MNNEVNLATFSFWGFTGYKIVVSVIHIYIYMCMYVICIIANHFKSLRLMYRKMSTVSLTLS